MSSTPSKPPDVKPETEYDTDCRRGAPGLPELPPELDPVPVPLPVLAPDPLDPIVDGEASFEWVVKLPSQPARAVDRIIPRLRAPRCFIRLYRRDVLM